MSTAQETQAAVPATDTQNMQGWVLRVASAKSQLAQARARLYAAEARKPRTWVSRLRSWFTASPKQASQPDRKNACNRTRNFVFCSALPA